MCTTGGTDCGWSLSEGQHSRAGQDGRLDSLPGPGDPGLGPTHRPPHRRHVPGRRPQRRPTPGGSGCVDRRHRHDRRQQGRRARLLQPGPAGPGDHCPGAILAKVWEEVGGRVLPPTRVKSCAATRTTRCGPRCGRWPGSCTSWTGAWSSPGCAAAAAAPGRPVDPKDRRPAQRRADPSQTRRRLAPDHPHAPGAPVVASDRQGDGAAGASDAFERFQPSGSDRLDERLMVQFVLVGVALGKVGD
jgi:hypothetical protein